jgi:hypothetical protein
LLEAGIGPGWFKAASGLWAEVLVAKAFPMSESTELVGAAGLMHYPNMGCGNAGTNPATGSGPFPIVEPPPLLGGDFDGTVTLLARIAYRF